MPISISGSGTITGINTGGLPDGCIATADLADNAVTYAKIGSTEQGQLCKAWVNFNGTTASPSTIRASYNVSSVTKNGTGRYVINFTNTFSDINYATTIACSPYAAGSPGFSIIAGDTTVAYTAPTTSSIIIGTMTYNASIGYDPSLVSVAIFR